MEFDYLDDESEKVLKDIISNDGSLGQSFEGEAIEYLVKYGFIKGSNISTTSSPKSCYLLIGLTQKGKAYFELKEKHEKELKRVSRREWAIGIIGAVIGYLIPTIVESLSKLVVYFLK